ncbi:MAG: AAA family ATPase, partial [Candidatus Methanomethylophilaceae archaeon]|nr:AAA family ATPase [Candidatus Methanomethylophilaceae archaeon]
MFYGRDRELALLEERYNSDRFEFLPVYGRRRVGKTRLLREFMAKHEGVFFTAKTRSLKENMDEFASKVYGADVSASLTSILDTIEKRSRDKRFILVIDEYPRLLSKDRSMGDTLQEFIDRIHEDSKLFLILCGSSISVMEHEVLGYKSPLYGRRTGSLELLPLSVWESMEFLRGFDRDDSLRIYGMVGGIPMYLGLFDPSYSLKENVIRLFLREDSFFRNE